MALPSPVVILSIIAIAMAGVAYLATQGTPPTEREVTTVARDDVGADSTRKADRDDRGDDEAVKKAPKKDKPAPVKRSQVFVEVYNNSGITGLAGQVGGTVADAGWQVVGTDNWYGSVPSSTVYYPADLKRAGKQLALDLGLRRWMPAVDSMSDDRLTVVLTAPLG